MSFPQTIDVAGQYEMGCHDLGSMLHQAQELRVGKRVVIQAEVKCAEGGEWMLGSKTSRCLLGCDEYQFLYAKLLT